MNLKVINTLLLFIFSVLVLFAVDPVEVTTLTKKAENTSGEEKVMLLHQISDLYIQEGNPEAITFSQQALEYAQTISNSSLEIDCRLHLASKMTDLGGFEEAEKMLSELTEKFPKLSTSQEAEVKGLQGLCYFLMAKYDLAEKPFMETLEWAIESGTKTEIAGAHRDLATNYRYMGNYDEAITHFHKATAIFQEEGDTDNINYVKEEMGIVHFLLGAHEEALASFQELLQAYTAIQDSGNMAYAHNLVGVAFYELKDYQSSIFHHEEAYKIRKEISDVRGLGETLNNMALPHMALGNWAAAASFLEQSIGVMEEVQDYRQIPKILGNIGDAKRELGKEQEALSFYQQSIEMAEGHGGKHTQAKAHEKITDLYKELGNFEKALFHQSKYHSLRDSLFNEEKTRIIEDMQAKYKAEEREREIADLEAKNEQARKQRINLIFGLLAVLIITILIISRQRLKIRKDGILHEKELQILKAKEELTAKDLRMTQAELAHHKSELTSYMQNVLSKNALVEELEAKLQAMKLQGEDVELERKVKLDELLELKILTDEDWVTFKKHFDRVYVGFFDRLRAQHPDLTKAERRLFVLLKLNLSSSEIANILGISPESVKKGRYRLRKKLALHESENLQAFIEKFG